MNKSKNFDDSASRKVPSRQVEKRIRRLQEDILGVEALGSAYLEQAAGEEILSWSMSGIASIASETEGMDENEAEISMTDRLRALRKLMRHLGRLLGEGKAMGEDDRTWFWNSIQKQAGALYGRDLEFPALEVVMGQLESGESPKQIISRLRKSIEKQRS